MDFTLPPEKVFVWQNILRQCGKENVYLVGGFVRDTLLGRQTMDMDICCRLHPEQIRSLFPDSLYYPKFGTVTFHSQGVEVTIAALRKESQYQDFRHPGKVTFVSSIEEDFPRRDFTINCLYVDASLTILDPTKRGLSDLANKTLHVIGEASTRLREDPLRILRAYRFSYELGFTFDGELKRAISDCLPLIRQLKEQKIREEMLKCPIDQRKKMLTELHLDLPDIV